MLLSHQPPRVSIERKISVGRLGRSSWNEAAAEERSHRRTNPEVDRNLVVHVLQLG